MNFINDLNGKNCFPQSHLKPSKHPHVVFFLNPSISCKTTERFSLFGDWHRWFYDIGWYWLEAAVIQFRLSRPDVPRYNIHKPVIDFVWTKTSRINVNRRTEELASVRLTLCLQLTAWLAGLENTWHVKYTSSPA